MNFKDIKWDEWEQCTYKEYLETENKTGIRITFLDNGVNIHIRKVK